MDDLPARLETSLPPLRNGGKPPDGMTAEERAQWMWETRLKQLVVAEAEAWRQLAWAAGIYFGLLLLIPLGMFLADTDLVSHVRSARPGGVRRAGLMLQGFGWTIFLLLGIPVLRRSIHWIKAMWRRRRFSSAPGADPGQLR